METAKVAIFRTLIGLLAILWLIEWGLIGRLTFFSVDGSQLTLVKLWPNSLKGWLIERPSRLIIIAAMFYFAVVLIGTALSQSVNVSIWGRIPGTDTTATYTAICHILLFGVIVTHLKTRPQLWRLFAAVIGVGVMVGGYSVLQYYGQDFFLLGTSGGARMSSTLGNPIFASSFLLITISISLTVAVLTLLDPVKTAKFWQRAGFWSVVLGVQLIGTVFTLSRGPWVGTAIAVMAILVLFGLFVGWSALGRAGLVLGVAAALTAFVVVVPTGLGWYERGVGDASALAQIEGRFTAMHPEDSSGSLGQRIGIWRSSGQVITQRPWFESEDLDFSALRPVVGYGPDMFVGVFMLGSRPVGPKLLPFETTHAHNLFIHHWVELGILGLLAALSIFVFPAVAVGWEVLRNKRAYPISHNVLLIGLVCVLAGRFGEQMFGVAKVSDSLIFWVVLAILVSLATVMSSPESNQPPATRVRRRGRGRTAGTPPIRDSGIYWRCAVVVLLIGVIVALTWGKNVNYLRALNQVAGLNQAFINGNLNDSVTMLKRAIERAPDVYHYHANLGLVYSAYQSETVQEPDCNLLAADVASYEICLAKKVSESYAAEVAQSSWRWRSRLDLAEAELDLFRLTQDGYRADETVRLYRETAAMMPHSWKLRNQLAQMLTAVGDPEESLLQIEKSLAITGSSLNSADAMLLKGQAYNNLGNTYIGAGQYQQAVESYDEAIRLNPEYALAYNNRGGAYVQLGEYETAIADYGAATRINPLYANAYFNRALAYVQANRIAEARQDLTKAADLGVDGAKLEYLIDQLEAGAGAVQPVRP